MHRIRAVCAVLVFALVAIFFVPMVVFNITSLPPEIPVVTVYDGDIVAQEMSGAYTVGELLYDMGISLTGHDRINYPLEFPIYNEMSVRIDREVSFYISINTGLPQITVVTAGTTVEEVLIQTQAIRNATLVYNYDLTREIAQNDTLNFLTWRTREFNETNEIPFETIENRTAAMRNGQTHLRRQGSNGEHEITTMVIYIGDYEYDRVVINEYILREPIDEIFSVGTAPMGAITDPSDPDFRYVRQVRLQATAYCACFLCTGRNPEDALFGITASGRRVEHGIVAVDRTVFPLGTRFYVAGYGFAEAADVGGAIRGYMIDLFMYCHQEALRFGRRYVDVWVLH